ncbi:DUF4870 domain-containing protein [Nocardioides aestuarii]|uniref:DUF4870 domain-containing protein n=1 Tax=Nocardioides aestuarii TaxID=252231 RepID=A0ABW4TRJ6_9ACTN
MSDPYGAPQQPAPQSADDNTWAMAAHIGALVAAWFAFGFLAPLVVMLVKADSPYVRRHAVESLNFQISILIYGVVGTIVAFVLAIVTLGIGLLVIVPVAIAAGIAILIVIILATMAASRGEDYRYPLTIRFIS